MTTVFNDTTEGQLETQEIGPAEEQFLHQTLVETWVKSVQVAESMHLCLHPGYVRHTEEELTPLVELALQQHRGPSKLIAEILACGMPGTAGSQAAASTGSAGR